MVRVRFAPSPTGYLHIGGARTALFNHFFARHNKGKFILRIEDTDKQRSKKEYLDLILEDLRWLGIHWDEGPYFQSQRLSLYQSYAQRLINEGKAYYQKSKQSNFAGASNQKSKMDAIIFKITPQKIKINDLIHGEIEFDTSHLKDLVIMKSDGTPTYNFACTLDDALMEITHIIRGDDHISNTPKQIALYQALNLKLPLFAHIPLIVDKERKRLSKRGGAQPLSYYRSKGYLPAALVNYLSLLGWSAGKDREIITKEEIIKQFRLEDVNKTAAAFDSEKLTWMNGQYIKGLDASELTNLLLPLLTKEGYKYYHRKWLEEVVRLFKERIRTLNDFIDSARFFFIKEITYEEKAKEKYLSQEGVKDNFRYLVEEFEKLERFDVPAIESCMRSLAERLKIKAAKLIHPARVALTGTAVSPPLFETIVLLGKERTVERLKQAICI